MKSVIKKLALFVWLVLVFSAFTACNSTSAGTSTEPTANAPANTADVKPKINYPPVPAAIMTSEVKLLDGTSIKLSDKKGKVVLVNLWATWCQPCIAEMPHLVELQEKYRDQGFEVIGLDSDDESKEDVEAFGKKQKLNYTLGWADGAVMTEFVKLTGLQGIPQSILINREGQLTGVFTGGGMRTVEKLKETVPKIVAQ